MEVTNSGGAALYALQQALRQPQYLVTTLTETAPNTNQRRATAASNEQLQKAAAVQAGKGTTIDILI